MARDVNDVLRELPGAVRNRTNILIPNELLTDHHRDTSSDNYPLVGGAARLWNAINGHNVDKPLPWQRAWWATFFADRFFMVDEQGSTTYAPHHIDSVLYARGAFVNLNWSELVAEADLWLKALAGHLALRALEGGKCYSPSAVDDARSGPILLVGRQDPPRQLVGVRSVAWAGDRSAVQYALRSGDKGTGWSMVGSGMPLFLSVALGERSVEAVDALKARKVWSGWLSPTDCATAKRAAANDNSALDAVLEWVKPWPLKDPELLERTATSVGSYRLGGQSSSTSACDVVICTPDARTWAVSNTGGRTAQARQSTCTVDLAARTFVAQSSNSELPPVRGKMAPGPVTYRVRFVDGKVVKEIGGGGSSTPPVVPGSSTDVTPGKQPGIPPAPADPPPPPKRRRSHGGCGLFFLALAALYGAATAAAVAVGRMLE